MTEIYSVGPLTAGSGLNITVWSYVDQLNISVLSDGSTLKDPHELTDAMITAFIEIRRAAGLSEELTSSRKLWRSKAEVLEPFIPARGVAQLRVRTQDRNSSTA